jgi:hypothetical protein
MKVGVQCSSMGDRCGIWTYTDRLIKSLNKVPGIEAFPFVDKIRGKCDIINIQYEPGLMPVEKLQWFLQKYSQPMVITAHHTGYLQQFYPMVDGIIFHSKNQIVGDPWNHKIITHPCLVYPEKGKMEMRKKYNLPLDKKILGTSGFIAGTGKELPIMLQPILENIKSDEFIYFITSFWKGGDFSALNILKGLVKDRGLENQFRVDIDFVRDEELNEKIQCCDMLFSWNNSSTPGGTSGIAMDIIGARRKLIVKDVPHYAEAASLPGVEKGRQPPKEFIEDVFKVLRTGDLNNVPNPEPLSWDNLVTQYVEYYKEILGV